MELSTLIKDSWEELTFQYSALLLATGHYISVAVLISMEVGPFAIKDPFVFILSQIVLQALVALEGLKCLYLQRGIQLSIDIHILINYLISNLVLGVATFFGVILLVIPGLMIMSLSFIAPIYILKDLQGPLEAIFSSVSVLRKNRGKVTVLVSSMVAVLVLIDYLASSIFSLLNIPPHIKLGIETAISLILWVLSLPLMVNLYFNNQG